jgi:hypothetical protein
MKLVLSVDPSGNYIDGKGHTGLVVAEVNDTDFKVVFKETIRADKFDSRLAFWKAHTDAIDLGLDLMIIEDFMLYPHVKQGFSYMETPRLLGIMELDASVKEVPVVFQRAVDIAGLSDDILVARGVLEKRKGRYWFDNKVYNDHERSALKHLMLWHYKEKKKHE